MKKILKYFFSIGVLFLISGSLFAQTQRTKGLRIGVDLSRFSFYYLQPEREGYEFSGDFEVKRDLYIVGEYGIENVTIEKESYNYKSEGYYFRAGFDRNFLKSENPNEYEMVFGGIRYGYASQEHLAENIFIQNPYWQMNPISTIPATKCNTHWMEVVAGVRAELFWNISIGWSVRGKIRLANSGYGNLIPYNVPGYGNGAKKSNLGLNFSIYYRIPLFKQTVDYKKPESK